MYKDKNYLDNHPEFIKILMETTINFAKLSKCAAKGVCCLLYKEGNIISIGLNGTAPGSFNCNDLFKKENGKWYNKTENGLILCKDQEEHHNWSLYNEIHAEVNAISKALVSVDGAVAFVNYSPCFNCAKTLVAFGITKIYYNKKYDDFDKVCEFLVSQGIDVIEIK